MSTGGRWGGHKGGQKCPRMAKFVMTFGVDRVDRVDIVQQKNAKHTTTVGKSTPLVRNMYIQTNAHFAPAPSHFYVVGVDICPPLSTPNV